jgi:Helix-turn-helix domain
VAFAFPTDIYRQLLGTDFRLLDELTFLAKQQQKKSGAAYCMPGRKYLAEKLSCSIRTISRSIARLRRLGILDAIQRRPVRGLWQTNLYKIRHWLGWRIGQLGQLLRKPTHRGTPMAHIASPWGKIETSDPPTQQKNAKGEEILARWKDKGLIGASSPL